jgi:endonuclease-8
MPEGHKIHFIACQHDRQLSGQVIKVTSPQGRFRSEARKVSRCRLDQVTAAGKHLFYHFEGQRIIHVHLGRYGKFRQRATPPPPPIGKVRMRMVADNVTIDLNGPTTCRVISPEQVDEVTGKLGPDPLAGGRKSEVLANIRGSRKPIGSLLLDQSVVSGVGNIFRAEVLFEIGQDPRTPGSELSSDALNRLWRSLSSMMKKGLRYGRIISVTSREAGRPLSDLQGAERFRVYGKQACPRCDGLIETIELASRKLYWCKRCQA